MANGATPFPTGGFLQGQDDQAPMAQGQATPPQPMALGPQQPQAQQNPLAGIDAMLSAGMGGQTPSMPTGQVVQARHGGLLTGLVGVLLDGLAGGMAPTAREAYEIPIRLAQQRQQQQVQQQQLQMQQQQQQQQMQEAPVRQKLQLAQLHMHELGIYQMLTGMKLDNVMGAASRKLAEHEMEEGNAEAVTTGTKAQMDEYLKQVQMTDMQTGLHHFKYPTTGDPDGQWSVYKFFPDKEAQQALDIETPDLNIGNVDLPGFKFHSDAGANVADRQDSLKTQMAGYLGMVKLIGETQKPGTFEEQNYRQWAANPKNQGKTMMDFVTELGKANPQYPIRIEELAMKEQEHELKMSANQYWAYQNGIPVAGSMEQLKAAGIDPSQMTKQTLRDEDQTNAAREMIAPNGLFASAKTQMLALAKEGKLGPIAGNWNNFWAGKGLDGQQQAFLNTLKLVSSRLAQAHINRMGSVNVIEHFEHFIPQGSTPDAFTKELASEYEYMQSVAKLPRTAQ